METAEGEVGNGGFTGHEDGKGSVLSRLLAAASGVLLHPGYEPGNGFGIRNQRVQGPVMTPELAVHGLRVCPSYLGGVQCQHWDYAYILEGLFIS